MRLGKLGNITDKIIDSVLDTILDEGSELIDNVLDAVRNSDIIDEIIEEVTEAVIEQIVEALTGEEANIELGDDYDEPEDQNGGRTDDLDDEEFGIEYAILRL